MTTPTRREIGQRGQRANGLDGGANCWGKKRSAALRGGAALTPGSTTFDCEVRLCDAPGLGGRFECELIDLRWGVVPRTAAEGSELEVGG